MVYNTVTDLQYISTAAHRHQGSLAPILFHEAARRLTTVAEDDNAPPRDGADNKPKSSSGRTAGRDPGGRASRSGRIRLGWDRESRSGLGSGRGAGTRRRTRGGVRSTESHTRDAEGSRDATGDGRGKSRSGRSFRGASGGASEVDARDV